MSNVNLVCLAASILQRSSSRLPRVRVLCHPTKRRNRYVTPFRPETPRVCCICCIASCLAVSCTTPRSLPLRTALLNAHQLIRTQAQPIPGTSDRFGQWEIERNSTSPLIETGPSIFARFSFGTVSHHVKSVSGAPNRIPSSISPLVTLESKSERVHTTARRR